MEGHAVRGYYELERFLTSGTVAMGEERYNHWEGNEFAVNDLYDELLKDTTYLPFWECMSPITETYLFAECRVLVSRRPLDMLALADRMGFKVACEELIRQQEAYEELVGNYSLLKEYPKRSKGSSNE